MNAVNFGYLVIALILLFTLTAFGALYLGLHRIRKPRLRSSLRDLPFIVVGVSPAQIRQYPLSDQVWYAALGVAMLMIALLAAIGMGLSVYQFTQSATAAIAAALFWSALILAVDRLMVIAIDKFEPVWKSWLKAAPRLVMVVALSFVVSHTIIQWMFAPDINRMLVKMNREIEDSLNRDLRQRQAEIQRRIAEINEQLKPIDAETSQLNLRLPKEVAGEGDSGKRGDGKVAAALRESLRQAQERKDVVLAEKAKLEAEVKGLDQQAAENNNAHQGVLNAPAGLLDRARAVERLCADNVQARMLNWALMIGLLLIESIPLFSKLLSRPSQYDVMVHQLLQRNDCLRTIRGRIYQRFSSGDLSDSDYQSPLVKDFWADVEKELRAELTITREGEAVSNPESTVTVYLSEPGTLNNQNRLFVNFGLPRGDILGAHLLKALEKIAALNDLNDSHWLSPGQFEVLNSLGKALSIHQPLFEQLPDDTAFVVPVIVGVGSSY